MTSPSSLTKAEPSGYSVTHPFQKLMLDKQGLRVEEIPLGDPRLQCLVKFHWQLYKGDSCWTPPLKGELLGNRLLGMKGLLTPEHPYHRHNQVTHFLAWRGKQPAGSISAAIRNNDGKTQNHTGFFGFFEVVNDYEVAQALLDEARNWVEKRGMTALRGPGQYSTATHERQGILIDGFQHPPTMELTHNPPYYAQFLEQYGFHKVKDYDAYIFNRENSNIALIRRLAQSTRDSLNVQTRQLDMKNFRAEVHLIVGIYNQAWAQNWGFQPISAAEGDAIADSLQVIADPGLVRFAYIDGKAVAVMGILPDPNYALCPQWHWYGDSDPVRFLRLLLMRRRITRTRAMFFGIKPEFRKLGIPALLSDEIVSHILPRHYLEVEASLILEDNVPMIKIINRFGGKHYKKWRIYELSLK